MAADITPLRLHAGIGIEILDQTLLPLTETYRMLRTVDAVCEAIRALRVRGAPLLGTVGAAGMAVAGMAVAGNDDELRAAAAAIIATRPTAADLAVGVRRAFAAALTAGADTNERRAALWETAAAMAAERVAEDLAIGHLGAAILPPGAVLTHCNAGGLATGGIGTALGIVRTAFERGTLSHCFATETRPLLQGARLTMFELERAGIPATLVPDTAAASLIASGRLAAIVTGADRIAANGDSANKVGTYGLAAVAARHGVPFIIAAPLTTFDPTCSDGAGIPIEFRADGEVGGYGDVRWARPGTAAYNPAFDVTPAELIAAIVTEAGVLRPPYSAAIAQVLRKP